MPVDKAILWTKDKSGIKQKDLLDEDEWKETLSLDPNGPKEPAFNASISPFEDIHMVWHYYLRFASFQTIIFKD